jgi:hypothetical protein
MILSKLKLVENIVSEISDNATGQISPYDIRHNLLDIIDSVHLLSLDKNIKGLNFETQLTRTTRAGENTIANLGLEGYVSIDNSAFGYQALKANYQGSRNTAIGANSLSCNVFGDDNVALGTSSLAGNTVGIGNIGLGNYSLNNNKAGNFNIAIGHGAGYYVEKDTSNKLFIASHAVDEDYICDNPTGEGLKPLIYGDLSLNKLGINVTSLHNSGTLQVGGSVSPSQSGLYNLGNSGYSWKDIYLSNSLIYSNNLSLSASGSSFLIKGHLIPQSTDIYNIGSSGYSWNDGYFNDIYISNVATMNQFVSMGQCKYAGKTLRLAASNDIDIIDGGGAYTLYDWSSSEPMLSEDCDYLPDDSLSGAGFMISASGADYVRDYKFIFSPPSQNTSCDSNPFAQATWKSNISITLDSGTFLRTNNIISHDNNCYGLYFNNNSTIIGRKNLLNSDPTSSSGHLAGIVNINFISNSGSLNNYFTTVSAVESGVHVGTRFLTGIKNRVKDSNNLYLDKLSGFELKYIDDSRLNLTNNNILTDRFVISSYNKTSTPVNSIVLTKGNNNGVVGINNLTEVSENILPNTILDIRSTGDSIIRSTCENINNTISAIQLFGEESCENKGVELAYINLSGIADLSMYKDFKKTVFFRLYDDNNVGLFTSSGNANATFTLGDITTNNIAISMIENSTNVTSTAKYGKLFVKTNPSYNQSHSLYFLDGSGNLHDLVVNKFNTTDAKAVFTDANCNTFAGALSPDRRDDIPSALRNSSFGCQALRLLTTGYDNIAVGAYTGSGITSGYKNILIGNSAGSSLTTGYSNIAIGDSILLNSNSNNNIVIGQNGIGNSLNSNYNFLLGSSNSSVLLHGITGPTNSDKKLIMPSGGKLVINDNTNSDNLSLYANTIEVVDNGGNDYPDNSLNFKFTGNSSANLLTLKNHVAPQSITPTYQNPPSPRPYAELNGDLRLLGSVRFNDNTSLSSASFLSDISSTSSNVSSISNFLSNFIIEGYCQSKISAPNSSDAPTEGEIITKNQQWQNSTVYTIFNRDTTLEIHAGAYVIAIKVNNEYRPIWISSNNTAQCCQ